MATPTRLVTRHLAAQDGLSVCSEVQDGPERHFGLSTDPDAIRHAPPALSSATIPVEEPEAMAKNVLGAELELCSTDPMTGWFRDGTCNTDPQDRGSHTVCAVVTREFLDHQRNIGNDLTTPMPQYRFPGLSAGDRWCVTAPNWLRAHHDGAAAPVVLASTHERVLDLIPLEILRSHAVDVPSDPSALDEGRSSE